MAETNGISLRVLQAIAEERNYQDDRMRAQHESAAATPWPYELLEKLGELCAAMSAQETLTNLRSGVVTVAAVAALWAEHLTRELEKSTAAKIVTSAGTVATREPEKKHDLAKYLPTGEVQP
jgi:hypothetical protein